MSETGIQPRGDISSPRGINHVKVLRPGKIIARHCIPGEIIMVEPHDTIGGQRPVVSPGNGLTEDYAAILIRNGFAKQHQLQPGDRPVSARPKRANEDPKIETATNKAPAQAEWAVSRPQRGAV